MKLSVKITREKFKEIYQETYNNTLRFIVVKCNNMENINDIIQDTYLELLKIIKKQKVVEVDNINNYVLGIANNIIKRHYYQKKKENIISYYSENEKENEKQNMRLSGDSVLSGSFLLRFAGTGIR